MDKETLSNYGWIVICVLVLAVMLALASPFGTFVSDAVKSTTAGLFGVNQNALGAVGIDIADQAFCDHENITIVPAGEATEEHPAHNEYTACADCGKVMTENGEIPYQYTNFTITESNRGQIGYTGAENENLVIPETFYDSGTWYKVTSIYDSAFYNCDNLVSINIPTTVTQINALVFQSCNNLTSVIVPNTITYLGNSIFSGCTNLTSVSIPENVTSIGKGIFNNCSSLTSIVIPNAVTSIDSAFFQCTNLTKITIPQTVSEITANSFFQCGNLNDIVFQGTTAQWTNITKGASWNYGTGNYTIHCTDGCLDKSENQISCTCTDHTN